VIRAQDFADVTGLQDVAVAVYVQTSDLDCALREVERLGGKRVRGPIRAPDGRRLALFSDPEGRLVGLVEPVTGSR
jgi:predicted enzyme related to lactoylglutathione lyase